MAENIFDQFDQAEPAGTPVEQPVPTEQPAPTAEGPSLVGDITRGVVHGARDFGQSMLDLSADVVRTVVPPSLIDQNSEQIELPEPTKPSGTVGQIAESITQFGLAMVPAGRAMRATGLATNTLKGAAAQGAIADFIAFDEAEERLSNTLTTFDNPILNNSITQYLAASPEDGWAEGRLKNVIEGAGLGVATEAFFRSLRVFKKAKVVDATEGRPAAEKVLQEEAPSVQEALDGAQGWKVKPKAKLQAAVRYQGNIYTGPNHYDAAQSAAEAAGKPVDDILDNLGADAQGFTTLEGQFYNRVEAAKLIGKEGTAPGKGLDSSDLLKPEAKAQAMGRAKIALGDTELDPSAVGMKAEDVPELQRRVSAAKAGSMSWDEALGELPLGSTGKALKSDEAITLINYLAQEVRRKNDGLWDTPQAISAARQMAEDMGADPALVLKNIQDLGAQRDDVMATMMAARGVEQSLMKGAIEKARGAAAGTVSEAEADQWLDLAVSTMQSIREAGSTLGRGLRVMQEGVDPVSGLTMGKFKAAAEDFAVSGDKTKFRKKLAQIEDPSTARRVLSSVASNRTWDVVNEYWINALLSGPKTHMINMTSNLIKATVRPVSDALGHTALGDFRAAADDLATYSGLVQYFHDSVKAAGVAFRREDNVLDPMQDIVEMAGRRAIPGPLGHAVRIPTRALLAEDEFFKQINYRAKLRAMASREGSRRGFKGDKLTQYISDRMEKGFDEAGRATDQVAKQYAEENTFTNQLEYGIGKWLQEGNQQFPALRQLFPFVRTPTNLFRDAWRHMPGIGLLERRHRQAIKNGGHEELAQLLGKQMVGGAVVGTAASLALSGRMTGGGPKEPSMRAAWLQEYQPYSVKVGDTWYSFERLDPLGMLMGIVADWSEVSGSLTPEDAEELSAGMLWGFVGDVLDGDETTIGTGAKAAGQGFMAVAKNVTSKVYLKSISEFLETVTSDDEWKWKRLWFNRVGSYVPNALRQVNPDAHLREVRETLDAIKSRVPGFSDTLEPRYDFMGKPIIRNGGPIERALSPVQSFDKPGHPVWNEMLRLEQSFMPASEKQGNVDLSKFKNRKGQSAYSRLNELVQKTNLEQQLTKMIQSDRYQRLSDNQDLLSEDVDYKGSKISVIQKILTGARKQAFANLIREGSFNSRHGLSLLQAYQNDQRNKQSARGGGELLAVQ